jgi:hypothetical protein
MGKEVEMKGFKSSVLIFLVVMGCDIFVKDKK